VSEPVARGLIPPKPNLGPEPWPEEQLATALFLGLAAVVCIIIAGLAWRALRRMRAQTNSSGLATRQQLDDSPRGRLLALSLSMREALAAQFGTPWRAKTTEELAADAQLEQVLGGEGLRELIRFLDQVDRLKFAPERSNDRRELLESGLAAWQPRVEEFRKKIRAQVGGRPKANNATAAAIRPRSALARARLQPPRQPSAR
jgi:hypothetical protein